MKFDGILLCTDLDDTLLREDKSISEENIKAIEHFKQNGGKFTFITGRTHVGVFAVLEAVKPNAPIGCLNGCSIYDHVNDKNLAEVEIDKSCTEVIDCVVRDFPGIGIEVVTHEHNYFCIRNFRTDEHQRHENLPNYEGDYHTIPGRWAKILIMDEKDVIDKVIEYIKTLEPAKNFDFVRSTDYYYEILPKGASKGNLVVQIADILGIDRTKTIAVGDNENDISMLKAAGTGYAVANAVKAAKDAADKITVSNADHAIAKIISELGEITD